MTDKPRRRAPGGGRHHIGATRMPDEAAALAAEAAKMAARR